MFGKYGARAFNFQKTLDNFYSHQHKDGFISRELCEFEPGERFARHDLSSTGPNILGWSEWEYYCQTGDTQRLEMIFDPLLAYHLWLKEHRTWRDGTYWSTGWGCGMDNIPRQSPEYDPRFSHGHMVWVDTCMQELLSCKVLIDMANTLGRSEFIKELEEERDLLENIINQKLWDEKTGFYYDLWRNGKHNMVRHIGGLWAFISGCANKDKADRLIAYLNDENEFKTDVRVPTLSKSHSSYSPIGGYWCGSVWAPTNYMILKGLDKYGEFDLAHEIGVNYLDAVVEVCNASGTLYENYAPEFANGKADRGNFSKPNFVGWTGIAPISVLFEYVFGIKPYAEQNKIVWHVNLLEKHGIEKYPFGKDGELTLVCEKRQSLDEMPKITFSANIPVELEIVWGNKDNKQKMIING
jgi:glycogen debranching enzyme